MTEISQRRHFFDNPDRYDTDTEEITGSLHRSRCVYKLGLWELTCVLLQDLCTCHVPMGNIQLQFMISGIVNIVNFPHNIMNSNIPSKLAYRVYISQLVICAV